MKLMRMLIAPIAMSGLWILGSAQAAELAHVEAVQTPAWVERDAVRQAVNAGAPIMAGDLFITGRGGRLHLALADGSVVKLGEQGELRVPVLDTRQEAGNAVLSAALGVLKGAFRFTSRALNKFQRHEIAVSIGSTITAGVRGTDIWGKSEDSQDLICLLEGRLEVSSPGATAQMMAAANTFYVVPRNQAPSPVAPVPAEMLSKWVPQTELSSAAASLSRDGAYMVGLESHEENEAALAAVAKFSTLGYATEILRVQLAGKTWYRVVVTGLATTDDARRYAQQLRRELKLKTPWVISPPRM